VSGNGAGDGGVQKRVKRAYAYEPAFGRLFHSLALTPDRVARVAIAAALAAYLVPRIPPLIEMLAPLLTLTLGPALAFSFFGRRIAYLALAVGIFLGSSAYASTPDRVIFYFVGIGGAASAIAAAAHRSGRDHAFDNFDRFLSVSALALCWSTLGAWLANAELASRPGSFGAHSGVLISVALAIPISVVSIVGDARRLLWLRRLNAGKLAGYAVKAAPEELAESDLAALPALMGGGVTDAVLIARQSIPGLPFRSGWREIPVARVPSDPKRLVHRAGLWLFAVAVALATELILAVLALMPR
jgi:hypothetical protein